MLQPDCQSILEAIQSLTHKIGVINDQIDALGAEAMELHPLQYFVLQRRIVRLGWELHTLQDKWSNAMNELAICRSTDAARHFDRDSVLLGR